MSDGREFVRFIDELRTGTFVHGGGD